MSRFVFPGLLLVAVGLMPSCRMSLGSGLRSYSVGEERKATQNVALRRARRAQVAVDFGPGMLEIRPGATEVLSVDSRCNVRALEPVLDEHAWGRDLRVELRSRDSGGKLPVFDADDIVNEWSVQLAEDLPVDLVLNFGAGEATMDLGGLQLESAELDIGAASVEVDFSRPNGSVLETMRVDAGATSLELLRLGNARCRHLVLDGAMGEFLLDLGGQWTETLRIDAEVALGELRIRVPKDVAVEVHADTTMADVSAGAFSRDDGVYRNEAARRQAEPDVLLFVELSLGSLNLVEVEGRPNRL